MPTRREFLGVVGAGGVLAGCESTRSIFDAADRHVRPGEPAASVARNEDYWAEIARAYDCEAGVLNLNNAGVSPAPLPVQAAMRAELEFSNRAPSHHLWNVQMPRREAVRERLARRFGVSADEIAITRNTSEGLQTCQFGFDLRAGDEVLCTELDYRRMLWTFQQRERREGIKLVTFALPVPCDDLAEIVELYRSRITARTKLILACQVITSTAQRLPIKEIVDLGRERGIPVVVDGAHGFGHLVFDHGDLDCDFYATSLHKWLCAPHGTGMFFVRRDKIESLWPLMAARASQASDVRKFEEVGTTPMANPLAIDAALDFQERIGDERKFARLVHLRDRWARRLAEHPQIDILTSLAAGHAAGFGAFSFDGLRGKQIVDRLWREHRIITTSFRLPDGREGVRVSAHVYTSAADVDRFCRVVEQLA